MGDSASDTRDTPQQAKILRSSPTARKVRARFLIGTRVTAADHDTGVTGTVIRHIPGLNAQGGTLVVAWDTGPVGRVSAGSLRIVSTDPALDPRSANEGGEP